jgi:hypothetical protein
MNKEFTTYEQALALKDLDFDEPCFAWYVSKEYGLEIGKVIQTDLIKDAVVAPTFHQAFRWFREKYGYYVDLFVDDDKTFGFMISYFVEIGRADKPIQRKYNTYEEAEQSCLDKLIQIVKSK